MKPLAALSVMTIAALSLTACADDPKASGGLTVNATDSACTVSQTDLKAGPSTFKVTNKGSKVTEFYVYADGDRIMFSTSTVCVLTYWSIARASVTCWPTPVSRCAA